MVVDIPRLWSYITEIDNIDIYRLYMHGCGTRHTLANADRQRNIIVQLMSSY